MYEIKYNPAQSPSRIDSIVGRKIDTEIPLRIFD